MKRTIPLALVAAVLGTSGLAAQGRVGGWNPEEVADAHATIEEFKAASPGIESFFENATGYAVFSSVGRGAIIVGGAHGKGVVFEGGEPVGRTTLTQATIGLAIGGQAYAEIIFFEKDSDLEGFKNGNLKFSAQTSAVIITEGASADLSYSGGVAIVTKPKGGAMAEVSLGGQGFSFEPYEPDGG